MDCSLFSASNPFKRRAVSDCDRAASAVDDQPARKPKKPRAGVVHPVQEDGDDEGEQSAGGSLVDDEDRYDSEEKLQRTIFVGNLPLDTKKKLLIRTFSSFGTVESVRLRSVPIGTVTRIHAASRLVTCTLSLWQTKLPRKGAILSGNISQNRSSLNGYVVFTHADSAKAALAYNMTELGGKHIRVDLAGARSQLSSGGLCYDKTRSIFVGNLPLDVEDEELYTLFSSPDVGLEAVRVVRDQQTNIGKGFAFVLFKSKDGVKHTFGRGPLEVRNRKLRIRRVTSGKKSSGDTGRAKTRRSPEHTTADKQKSKAYQGARSGQKKRAFARTIPLASCENKSEGERTKRKRPAVLARKARQKDFQAATL